VQFLPARAAAQPSDSLRKSALSPMACDLLRGARATFGRLMEHGMFVLGSAVSSGWELLSSLQAQANAGAAAAGIGAAQFAPEGASAPVAPAGPAPLAPMPAGTVGQASLSPDVLGFLIWNQSQQPGAAGTTGTTDATAATGSIATLTPFQSALFSNLDTNGDGSISKSEFETAFGANGNTSAADTLFSQLDTNGDGSIDPAEFAAATQSSGAHGHHHHAGFAGQAQSGQSDPLTSLFGASADGAATSSATNPDGSTTTTITYADGSAVTLTTPAQASSSGAAPVTPTTTATPPPLNAVNVLETLIQLQAQLLAPTAAV
jgi:hypothetical protein